MAELSIAVDRDLDRAFTIVTLGGEFNLASTPLVRTTLLKCRAECPLAIIVDVERLLVTSRIALTVFASVQRHQRHGPAVALALCTAPATPTGRVVQRMLGGTIPVYPSRDAAVAALQDRQSAMKRVSARLPADPRSASTARRLVAGACDDWGLGDLADAALLVVSELVSNAVRHAGTDFDLTAMLRGPYLHLAVRDGSIRPPLVPQRPGSGWPALTTSGRGMHLVESCAAGWGTTVGGDGKIVWAMLRTTGGGPG
jgi:anti-sigma regulatory factor (Ser/Thr protein kinase)